MAMYEQSMLQAILESFPVSMPPGTTIADLMTPLTPYMPIRYSSTADFALLSGYVTTGQPTSWGDYGVRMGFGTGEVVGNRQLETTADLEAILALQSPGGVTWSGTIPHFFTLVDPGTLTSMHTVSWTPVCNPIGAPALSYWNNQPQPPRVCHADILFGW